MESIPTVCMGSTLRSYITWHFSPGGSEEMSIMKGWRPGEIGGGKINGSRSVCRWNSDSGFRDFVNLLCNRLFFLSFSHLSREAEYLHFGRTWQILGGTDFSGCFIDRYWVARCAYMR